MPESKFPKPTGGLPARGDASAFLNRDFGPSASVEAPAVQSAFPAPPPIPLQRGRKRTGELKIPITYKHRESNFRILKKISQRLEIPIGELLDEALEARFPLWRDCISKLPPDEI